MLKIQGNVFEETFHSAEFISTMERISLRSAQRIRKELKGIFDNWASNEEHGEFLYYCEGFLFGKYPKIHPCNIFTPGSGWHMLP